MHGSNESKLPIYVLNTFHFTIANQISPSLVNSNSINPLNTPVTPSTISRKTTPDFEKVWIVMSPGLQSTSIREIYADFPPRDRPAKNVPSHFSFPTCWKTVSRFLRSWTRGNARETVHDGVTGLFPDFSDPKGSGMLVKQSMMVWLEIWGYNTL
jgi:hypothetical protein